MKRIKTGIFATAAGIAAFLLPMQAFAAAEPIMSDKMKEISFESVNGIVLLFIILAVAFLIISYLRSLIKRANRSERQKDQEQEPENDRVRAEPPEPSPEESASQPDTLAESKEQSNLSTQEAPKPQADDTELVAVIAAAIAAEEQVPVGSFVVRTIKRRV